MWQPIEENDEIIQEFKPYRKGLVRYGPQGWVFAPNTAKMISKFEVILNILFTSYKKLNSLGDGSATQ